MNSANKQVPVLHATDWPGAHIGGILRYLTSAGLVFLALMIALEPDVGFVAPPAVRLLFWTAQISAGLLVLQLVMYALTRILGASRVPSWALVLLSGVLGAVVLAPIYWLIGEGLVEQWLGYPNLPDDKSVNLGSPTVGNILIEEYLDIVGPVTIAWALICLPRLHWLVPPLFHRRTHTAMVTQSSPDGLAQTTSFSSQPVSLGDPPGKLSNRTGLLHAERSPVGDYPERVAIQEIVPAVALAADWRSRLPTKLGVDVIAVASELQYLRVWTPRGCALIIGALADVEAQEAENGLRVHRSWWVACKHVTSVRRTTTGAVCQMSDGRQVPVSRRRRAEVLSRFGEGAQYYLSTMPGNDTQTDLD
jgi:hypothetical protein